jgi:uncharacterized protein
MKTLMVVGTAAMFLVGGGILTHAISPLYHGIAHAAELAGSVGGMFKILTPLVLNMACGMVGGTLALASLKALSAIKFWLKNKL